MYCGRWQETVLNWIAFIPVAGDGGMPLPPNIRYHYTFTSLEEMAKSPLIDAVYIASPNFLHAEQSILCMKHGKHVLCEKPFASNAWEVREMIAASAKYDVTLMEAMKPILTPNFRSVRENLGRFGTIRRYFFLLLSVFFPL